MQPNDTLRGIAEAFTTSIETIMTNNLLSDSKFTAKKLKVCEPPPGERQCISI